MHKEELVRKVPLLPYLTMSRSGPFLLRLPEDPKGEGKKKVNIEDGGVKLKLFIKL